MEKPLYFIPTGNPWKALPWQITPGLDQFGERKIQIKYYNKNQRGGYNFKKYQVIYAKPRDWKEFKKELKG